MDQSRNSIPVGAKKEALKENGSVAVEKRSTSGSKDKIEKRRKSIDSNAKLAETSSEKPVRRGVGDKNARSDVAVRKRSASFDRIPKGSVKKNEQSAKPISKLNQKANKSETKPLKKAKKQEVVEFVELDSSTSRSKDMKRSESDQSLAQSGRWKNPEVQADGTESENEIVIGELKKSFASETNLVNVVDDGYESSENLLLDPQHPLLKRYQNVIHEQLAKQHQELKFSLKETEELLKRKQGEYKTFGESIHSIDTDLNKLRQNVDAKTAAYEVSREEHEKLDKSRVELKEKLDDLYSKLEQVSVADKVAIEELRRVNLQISDKKQDVNFSDHMKIVKNAVHKAKQDLRATKTEKAKQEQQVEKILAATSQAEVDLNGIDVELKRIVEELAEKRNSLIVINTELQAAVSEKRSLLQLWNATVNGMRKKGEELTSFDAYLKSQRDESVRVENELSALSKEYTLNRNKNDNLVAMLIKLEQEVEKCTTSADASKTETKEKQSEFDELKKTCDALDAEVISLEKERNVVQSQLNALTLKIRMEQKEIAKLEDEAMELSNESQTKDRAVDSVAKELKTLRVANRELEKQISELETTLAEDTMVWTELEERVSEALKAVKLFKEFVAEKQNNIDRTQNDIQNKNLLANKTFARFVTLNKRVNSQTKGFDSAALSEASPLKNEIASIQKSMQKTDEQVVTLQAHWLKVQDQLIKLNEKMEQENEELIKLDEKIGIYEGMKVRLNAEMRQSKEEIFHLERSVENLRTKIRKLNEDVTRKSGAKVSLESDRLTAEGQLASLLKDSEMECVQLEEKLKSVKNERDRALQKIEDAKKQISLWEEKVEHVKSTKDIVAGSKGQEDLILLRSQVHRMQLRCAQLSKQQEIMLKEMEKAVTRREILLKKGEAASMGKTNALTQTQLDSLLTGLRRKVKQYKKDLETSEIELEDMRNKEEALRSEVEQKVRDLKEVEKEENELKETLEDLSAKRHKNLQLLISKQVRHKNVEDAREGRYQRVCASADDIKAEMTKEKVKRERLFAIIGKLYDQFPHLTGEIKKAEVLLQS